ncbi:MAG: hypothetical protein JRD89_13925 [Deltaproteobacteria bacterium]|nr:hypothetical protein [Deltaproteobacteria bacterium]
MRRELKRRLRELRRERKALVEMYFRSWFRGADLEKGLIYAVSEYPTQEECALDEALEALDFEIEEIERKLGVLGRRKE